MNVAWISVTLHPGARKEVLVMMHPGRYEAWVKAKPMDGRANKALANLLSHHYQVPRSHIQLARGRIGRVKLFKITL